MSSIGAVPRVGELASLLDRLAPPGLALAGDNCGLLLGDPGAGVAWVAVALDAAHAGGLPAPSSGGNGFLVVYHPLFSQPFRRMVETEPEAALVSDSIRRRLSLYAAHTSFSSAPEGLSHLLAMALGLSPVGLEPLVPVPGGGFVKLVVFVPTGHTGAIRDALAGAGAGWIGNYSHTAFAARGLGWFMPREGARPHTGSHGEVEEAAEDRLEIIVPRHLLGEVVSHLVDAHPYEEPAYDIYPLESRPPVARPECLTGMGRVGDLEREVSFEDYRAFVEHSLGLPAGAARVVVPPPGRSLVRRVAVCPGSGGDYVSAAAGAGADVYVTGDISYGPTMDAAGRGLAIIEAGYLATEKSFVPVLAARIRKKLEGQGISTRVIEVPTPLGWQV